MDYRKLTVFLFLILSGMLFFGSPSSWCAPSVPVKIRIDESKEIRKVPAELFGFNHNWLFSERRFWNKERKAVVLDFVERLQGLHLPLNRMAGAESQFFRWKYAIGPIDQRLEQKLVEHGQVTKRIFGPVEWVQSTRLVDPEAKFSWVFNMENGSPADHADLVEFLVGNGKVNLNGGVNWAEKRIQLGLTEPVKVSIWELGNELDFKKGARNWSVEHYIKESRKIIAAVRSVDPEAKIAAHAASAPWVKKRYRARDWREWHRKVLKEIGSQIDYISFHPYYLGVPTSEIEGFIDEIYNDIVRITGQDRIKIFISEHAVWPSKAIFSGSGTADWNQTHSLSGVLATAQFLNRLMARREVSAAAYHCFSGGPWGVIYKSKISGQLYTTGIFSLYRLFGSLAGMDLLQATVVGESADVNSRSLKFTVSVLKKSNFMIVVAVNRDGHVSRDATFTFNRNKYRVLKSIRIAGSSLRDFNDVYGKKIFTSGNVLNSKTVFSRFRFPSKSICLLVLQEI